jgi:hypothetical protein
LDFGGIMSWQRFAQGVTNELGCQGRPIAKQQHQGFV